MTIVARSFLYAVGIGSNRAGRQGTTPTQIVAAALDALDDSPLSLLDAGPIVHSAPIGPSLRRYANCAALIASPLMPDDILELLHDIEARFGRKRHQRWGARSLDLDLILWSEGSFAADGLTIPHRAFRERDFVLGPLVKIAPEWHDPLTGLSIRQLWTRLQRAKPVDRFAAPH
jgi:2-amino-4-hydroxy-6-hydroxymethyldihydropteridine diphosphokinase